MENGEVRGSRRDRRRRSGGGSTGRYVAPNGSNPRSSPLPPTLASPSVAIMSRGPEPREVPKFTPSATPTIQKRPASLTSQQVPQPQASPQARSLHSKGSVRNGKVTKPPRDRDRRPQTGEKTMATTPTSKELKRYVPPAKEANAAARAVEKQTLGVIEEVKAIPLPRACVALIDDSWAFQEEELGKLLIDQPQFTVIGVMGLSGCGKSTILSTFATSNMSDCYTQPVRSVFPVKAVGDGISFTRGVNAFVTPERVILLDTQPIQTTSANNKADDMPAVDPQSLRLAVFLLSVCHVVLVANDWLSENQPLLILLRSALVSRETLSSCLFARVSAERVASPDIVPDPAALGELLSEEFQTELEVRVDQPPSSKGYPDVVFVFNKMERADMSPAKMQVEAKKLHAAFSDTKLRMTGCIRVDHPQSDSGQVNFFCLPNSMECLPPILGSPVAMDLPTPEESLRLACDMLRYRVHNMPKVAFQPRLTEKEWLRRARKLWNELHISMKGQALRKPGALSQDFHPP
eukprot:gb/GEZN01003306.1/.p1 GENE.gb/GEZN01003306.1/~~gb/GEZN01003306.1/.p1  ORF type:complete len:520 (-),score=45.45 gb/GEZN01003306.1/:519-2078(-)